MMMSTPFAFDVVESSMSGGRCRYQHKQKRARSYAGAPQAKMLRLPQTLRFVALHQALLLCNKEMQNALRAQCG